jgi:hypothetical protein
LNSVGVVSRGFRIHGFMNAVPFSAEEIDIRSKLEPLRHVVGDQIIYGRDHERGTVLMFSLCNCYVGMFWRAIDQSQSRKSLAKGYFGLDEHGDPNAKIQELLKVRVSTLRQKEYRSKDAKIKSELRLARKLAQRIDKRSEKLLAGIDHLCVVLHRPPTQFELRKHLKMSGSTFSEVTHDTGLDWLPERKSGPAGRFDTRRK